MQSTSITIIATGLASMKRHSFVNSIHASGEKALHRICDHKMDNSSSISFSSAQSNAELCESGHGPSLLKVSDLKVYYRSCSHSYGGQLQPHQDIFPYASLQLIDVQPHSLALSYGGGEENKLTYIRGASLSHPSTLDDFRLSDGDGFELPSVCKRQEYICVNKISQYLYDKVGRRTLSRIVGTELVTSY